MATHWGGSEGTAKTGSNTISEIVDWSFDENVDPVIDNALGDVDETHIVGSGIKRRTGTITCHWDETDTTGQESLTLGASVTLNLYPEGSTTGDKFWSGTASITSIGISVNLTDTIKRTFGFRGNGSWTYAAVS